MLLLESIFLINPEFHRRKEIEMESQLEDNQLIEFNEFSNCVNSQLFNISKIDDIENSIVNEILEISKLDDNWNGLETGQISSEVINNSIDLVNMLRPTVLCHLRPENVYPSKFGTIIMDWDFGKGNFFSLEVAKQSVGYFTEKNGNPHIQKDNIKFDFKNNNSEIINSIHSDIGEFI